MVDVDCFGAILLIADNYWSCIYCSNVLMVKDACDSVVCIMNVVYGSEIVKNNC